MMSDKLRKWLYIIVCMKKRNLKLYIVGALIIANVVFIWGHSLMPKSISSGESGFLVQLLAPFFEIFMGEGNFTDHFIRKLAHFTEFCSLGILTALFMVYWKGKISIHIISAPIFSVIVSIIDEALQGLTDRAPQLSDVLLDTSGVLCGFFLVILIFWIWMAWKSEKCHV